MDILSVITANGLIEWWGLVVICVMLFLAGFVDAVAGGGGLISTPAFFIAGLPVHQVIGTNKLANVMGTALATIKYARQGYMVLWLCIPCVAVALVGSAAGSTLSLYASETVLQVVMLVVIPLAGFYVLKSKRMASEDADLPRGRVLAVCLAVSLVIGVYDGFYGPGTGTFLMLLLTAVGGLGVEHAAGVTKCVNLTTNLTALVVFAVNGTCVFSLGIIGGCFNLVGSYLGARMFTEKGADIVRPLMLVVLVIFALRLVAELAGIA